MKYNILYTGIFLDKKSIKKLKNWFKLKKQKKLLNNVCADVAVLSVMKKTVSEDYLSKIKLGDNVQLEICGYLDKDDIQMVICTAKSFNKKIVNNFLKIVISTNYNNVSLSSFKEENFIECNGPLLDGKIGYLNDKKEIILKLPEIHEDY
jgi:hypothetical protein